MATKHEQQEIAERRMRVAKAYLERKYQNEIAKAEGVCPATICNDLAYMRNVWLESALMDFNARKSQELATIDKVEGEYWDAWRRSQQHERVTLKSRTRTGKADKTGETKVQTRTKKLVGDARFLDGVMDCVKKRCEILGLNAPAKIAPTDPSGENSWQPQITDEERARRVLEITQAAIVKAQAAETGA